MATPQEKLADALETLHQLQEKGRIAIRGEDLDRPQRELLLKHGFLRSVMKGWYIASPPESAQGESGIWFTAYWSFCAQYLADRFGDDWSLTPELSLALQTGNRTVPQQLLVRAEKAGNKATGLLLGTSLFDTRAALPEANDLVVQDGLRLFSIPAALIAASPGYFDANRIDARAALGTIRDASELLERLLEKGQSVVAGRLAGAFRNIGRGRIADDILKTMDRAGYRVREVDPFTEKLANAMPLRERSPYAGRIRLMWEAMRGPIIERFPKAPGLPADVEAYLQRVQDVYVTDAYHSLSIEGYRVSPDLIERVRTGAWNPDLDAADRELRNGLAARGYWLAYQAVLASVRKVVGGANPGEVADADHGDWYGEMFSPNVELGFVEAKDLAGYRSGQVYLSGALHVPLSPDAVRDAMPVFFELLSEETEASVRVVLGHFIFVYIHPYMDGNGRTGRFLMNLMLAAGGFPWTVIPVERRKDYMAALEAASSEQNITPFADFMAGLVESTLKGEAAAQLPGAR
ncbi:Fic family protein [Sphingopyxis sp. R3-92]|uniref:Fic family protein n=1 Tax=Sphingopyxis sp. R3-92 TaxID=3158553 RepID=UPI003EE52F4B